MTKQKFYLLPALPSGVEGVAYITPNSKLCYLNTKEQQVLGQISSQ